MTHLVRPRKSLAAKRKPEDKNESDEKRNRGNDEEEDQKEKDDAEGGAHEGKKEEGEENILNWKLVIHDVKKKDEGFYQCQLNTDPTKARNAYLEVTSK